MLWCVFRVNSAGVKMMAWKYVFLVTGVTVAAIAYWLYTPVPDGYAPECVRPMQIMMASAKVVDGVVCVPTTIAYFYT